MTEIALKRRRRIIQWGVEEYRSEGFQVWHQHAGFYRGTLVGKRIDMIVGQAMIEPNKTTGLHLLDDDANWKIFVREMKFHAGMYYEHADMDDDAWKGIMYRADPPRQSMQEYFHRTKINRDVDGQGNVTVRFTPERVESFPAFDDFPYETAWQNMGFIGGMPELSSDATLRSLTIDFDGFLAPLTLADGQFEYSSGTGGPVRVGIKAEANWEAVGISLPPYRVLELGDNRFEIVVTAEDDTEQIYTVNVIRTA